MSDDLISRKALKANIEAIRECWAISPYVSADDIRLYANVFNAVSQCISDCPIAFDKEEVMDQLKSSMAKVRGMAFSEYTSGMETGYGAAIMDAIEIIEKGGIECDSM